MQSDQGTQGPDRVRIVVGFGTAMGLIAMVALTVMAGSVVAAASRPLGWTVAAIVVATLVSPLVDALAQHMARGAALALVVLIMVVVFGGAWGGLAASIASNVEALADNAPAAAERIEADSEVAADFKLEERVESFVTEIEEQLGTAAQLRRTTSTVSTYMVAGVLALFMIGYGPQFVRGGLRQIDDPERRERIADRGARAVHAWRIWILSTAVQIASISLVGWALFAALDLPGAFALGLCVGVLSALPYTGVVFGGLPALLFSAAFGGLGSFAIVLGFLLVVQSVEALAIRPRLDPACVTVGPLLPLIVGLIGWELYGFGGAMYGVILLVFGLAMLQVVETEQRATATDASQSGEAAASEAPANA